MPPSQTRMTEALSIAAADAPGAIVPVPLPEPGPGAVTIDVRAVALGYADAMLAGGRYPGKAAFPLVPGFEVAGRVARLGPGLTGLNIGDRVLAYAGGGGVARQVVLPAHRVLPIPDAMPYDQAAVLCATYGAAALGLTRRCGLTPQDMLLVRGAGGGVGLALCEVGRAIGAQVIGLARSAAQCRALADQGIPAMTPQDYAAGRQAGTAPAATVLADPVGDPGFAEVFVHLAWGGQLLVLGFAGGQVPAIPASDILRRGLRLTGLPWGQSLDTDPAEARAALAQVLDWWQQGAIHPRIGPVHDFADAPAALARLRQGNAAGRIILKVDDPA